MQKVRERVTEWGIEIYSRSAEFSGINGNMTNAICALYFVYIAEWKQKIEIYRMSAKLAGDKCETGRVRRA